MSALIILLLILSIILFIVSFFQKDQSSNVKKELDDLSMNLYQETYQMNKRIKVLEEELLVDDQLMKKELSKSDKPIVNEILRNQVIALFKQGLSVEQISKQSALAQAEVKNVIANFLNQ
ncbi:MULTISPECIES: hypothetical protein [Heyndrickxia]|jgi:uncharacterized protein YgiM (DUF1202 family)|uniref:Uncharacterized protein n=1 Tax=Heyndrickxia oleronia TaxID=38875 RepID=A0A8E2LC32_9BACI|nr:hypothetical protein [Heyndrickxia oleronia]NYV64582.1 hypothetical protein [Bacillus sp. Gen3]OJH18851.1 hypothetical protein BLX88_11735 [Bacillus obstructivus]MBU5213424.1 hypothetical protein [Heyndrickxia oleronia]MCI1593634.1 hypothetical protein [Heyndrickxia oleronia]MCI1615828.1 hypothetical protein [Heyndrickxia oleronia]